MAEPTWMDRLVNNIDVGIVVLDRDFKVHAWNPFMQNHSGLSAEKVLHKSLFAHFDYISIEWFQNKCEAAFDMQTPVYILWEQTPYLFKFTAARPITSALDHMVQNITILPIPNENPMLNQICILVYDVTDYALSKRQLDKANLDLQAISRIDGLTNLNNRRYWQECFEREYKLAMRNGSAITLMMLDIDHFKRINDNYGHSVGDRVIQMLGLLIKKATRSTDILGRYGGEEFAVVLPNTETKEAAIVAERLRRVVEKSTVKYEDQFVQFTISIGISQLKPVYQNAGQWLESADQALYKAKEAGRNRLVFRT